MRRTELIRKRARELLSNGIVKMVLGYRAGSEDGVAQPFFATAPEQTEELIFDHTCSLNIASYLLKVRSSGRVAVITKGCDARSIVLLLQEKQIVRENIYILGVGCEGMVLNGEKSIACRVCQYPNPVIYDEMIGPPAEKTAPDPQVQKVDDEFDRLTPDEKWQIISADIANCIRCYTCRQVCPNCYCPLCFVDVSKPPLLGKTHTISDNMVFHIIRALHMAGRCVECGACHRACPAGIDLMRFNRRVTKIVRERFGTIPGVEIDSQPPLTRFSPEDPQEFIK